MSPSNQFSSRSETMRAAVGCALDEFYNTRMDDEEEWYHKQLGNSLWGGDGVTHPAISISPTAERTMKDGRSVYKRSAFYDFLTDVVSRIPLSLDERRDLDGLLETMHRPLYKSPTTQNTRRSMTATGVRSSLAQQLDLFSKRKDCNLTKREQSTLLDLTKSLRDTSRGVSITNSNSAFWTLDEFKPMYESHNAESIQTRTGKLRRNTLTDYIDAQQPGIFTNEEHRLISSLTKNLPLWLSEARAVEDRELSGHDGSSRPYDRPQSDTSSRNSATSQSSTGSRSSTSGYSTSNRSVSSHCRSSDPLFGGSRIRYQPRTVSAY